VEHGQRRWERARLNNHNRTHAGPAVIHALCDQWRETKENRFKTMNQTAK
jgi:hypothetical protein